MRERHGDARIRRTNDEVVEGEDGERECESRGCPLPPAMNETGDERETCERHDRVFFDRQDEDEREKTETPVAAREGIDEQEDTGRIEDVDDEPFVERTDRVAIHEVGEGDTRSDDVIGSGEARVAE